MSQHIREFKVSDINDLKPISTFLNDQDHSKTICLVGDLGAGKTTLVKVFCENIGSEDETSSPTFSIVNEYLYPDGKIYHFDLYRLNDTDELMDIGIEDYLSSDEYCLIEWPELAIEAILEKYILVDIKVNPDNSRKVLISNV